MRDSFNFKLVPFNPLFFFNSVKLTFDIACTFKLLHLVNKLTYTLPHFNGLKLFATDSPCNELKYTCDVCFLQDILAGCKEALTLSPHSGVILERLSSSPLQKSNFLGSGSGKSSPGLSEEILASSSSTGSNHDDRTKHSTLLGARSVKGESEQASHDQSVFSL